MMAVDWSWVAQVDFRPPWLGYLPMVLIKDKTENPVSVLVVWVVLVRLLAKQVAKALIFSGRPTNFLENWFFTRYIEIIRAKYVAT